MGCEIPSWVLLGPAVGGAIVGAALYLIWGIRIRVTIDRVWRKNKGEGR